MKQPPWNNNRGSILMIAVAFSTILAIIVGTFLQLANGESRLSNLSFYTNNSLNLAEAGVEKALYALNSDDWTGWTVNGNDVSMDPVELKLAGNITALIQVRIKDFESDPTVLTQGLTRAPGRPDVTRQLEVHLSRRSLFANGITSRSSVKFSGGSASVDSYQSSKGKWSATSNRSYNGSVSSVSVAVDSIELANATIRGFVATGGEPPKVGPNGKVVGEEGTSGVDPERVALDFDAVFPSIVAPTNYDTYISEINSSMSLGDPLGDPNDPEVIRIDSISLTSGTLEIVGPVILHVTGNIRMEDLGGLKVASTGSLQLYADGNISIKDKAAANDTNRPEAMMIYGTNPESQNFELSGNGEWQAGVYAPNAQVKMNGGGSTGQFSGAVVADRVLINGGYEFHYDEDLVGVIGPNPSYRMDHWRELHLAAERLSF